MRWKQCVANRLYPKYRSLISSIDTGDIDTSIKTDSPNASSNEIIVTSSETDALTEDNRDEIEALIETITDTYELTCKKEFLENAYQYTLKKT